MKSAADMSMDEFRNLLATVTATPDVPPTPPGRYQRKVKPTAAQQPFWNKRKPGTNKRAKSRQPSRT